jgi:hypothetical protein
MSVDKTKTIDQIELDHRSKAKAMSAEKTKLN